MVQWTISSDERRELKRAAGPPHEVRPISERSGGPFAGRTRLETSGTAGTGFESSRNLERGIPPGDSPHPPASFPLRCEASGRGKCRNEISTEPIRVAAGGGSTN